MPKGYRVLVCSGPECGDKRGSADVFAALERALTGVRERKDTALDYYSCFGACRSGVNVLVYETGETDEAASSSRLSVLVMPTSAPGAVLYHEVRPDEAERLVKEHIGHGRSLNQRSGCGLAWPREAEDN